MIEQPVHPREKVRPREARRRKTALSRFKRHASRLTPHASSLTRAVIAVALACFLWNAGCTPRPSSDPRSSSVGEAITGDELFEDVVRTLNRLDHYVATDLQPPEVIRDANTSRNRKPMLAILTDHPDPSKRTGQNNVLIVRTNNGQFHRGDPNDPDALQPVRPGDRVRYFAKPSEAAKFGGAFKYEAFEMRVVAVPEGNDNVLIVAPGLNQPVLAPQPIEIWRQSDDRIREVGTRISRWVQSGESPTGWKLPRGKSPESHQSEIGWEPTPDGAAMEQIVDRLNQWMTSRNPDADWQYDPLIETLPEPLRLFVDLRGLDRTTFDDFDGRQLQQAVWLRDVASWARGPQRDPVAIAHSLFDWTVRNLQLETRQSLQGRHQLPWHAVLIGRGTAEERAWVFSLLAAQEGLDVVVLGVEASPGNVRFWLPALLHDGDLYLFDTRLGLAIPGPGGEPVGTLAQVVDDPSLLDRLDLPGAEYAEYPVSAADLERTVALVVSSPLSLSRRFRVFEENMAGTSSMAVSVNPSELAERLQQNPAVHAVRLWTYPYASLEALLAMPRALRAIAGEEFLSIALRPKLYKGRVMHLQGKFDFEKIRELYGKEIARGYDNESAKFYYGQVRPADSQIEQLGDPVRKMVFTTTKQHASYWLGLLAFDDGDWDVAEDFFLNRTIRAAGESPWIRGARYNLARTYESSGQESEAIRLYRQTDSPQSHGDRLRAKWLAQRSGGTAGEKSRSPARKSVSQPAAGEPPEPPLPPHAD